MSYAFYPMDLLLPPVTGFRTAISMLLLLLAGVITLCYVRRAFRSAARVPDPQSHPVYEARGQLAVLPLICEQRSSWSRLIWQLAPQRLGCRKPAEPSFVFC